MFERDDVLLRGLLDVLRDRRNALVIDCKNQRLGECDARRDRQRLTTGSSGSSTRSRASGAAPTRSRSSTTSSSGRTPSCRRTFTRGRRARRSRPSSRRRSRASDAGEFVPTPSEFACAGCPALDVVCAGPAAARRATCTCEAVSRLTCDHLVTYRSCVHDDELVFKALADPTRRFLLDRLFERDGRTLTELESELSMTRFGVMKHLRVLEEAGLVVTRRRGGRSSTSSTRSRSG